MKSGTVNDQADDQQPPLGIDLRLASGCFGILGVAAQLQGLEACRSHRTADFRLADDRRHVPDARFFGRVRHLGFEHAFQFAQRGFQTPRIVVIVEPLDDQIRFAGRDPVARALDARDQIGQPQLGRVELHTGPLGGQIHGCGLHTIQFFQVAFHGAHAVGTRHAGDGQGHLFGFGHRDLFGDSLQTQMHSSGKRVLEASAR